MKSSAHAHVFILEELFSLRGYGCLGVREAEYSLSCVLKSHYSFSPEGLVINDGVLYHSPSPA